MCGRARKRSRNLSVVRTAGCVKPKRRVSGLWAIAAALIAIPSSASPKQVLVYYRPWFVAKPYSTDWGWHWTMNHFNPDYMDASGQRQIASWYRPLIGPYDSADPAVLEYHVLLMKLSGIDGVVVDWHGPDDYLDYGVNNERCRAMFRWARKAGLKFVLCYEDQSLERQVAGGRIDASETLPQARRTLSYAQSQFFSDPAYLRLSNAPVLLVFGPQFFKEDAQWRAIFSALDPTNQPAFFTEDYRMGVASGAFDWPPMWLSLSGGARGVLSTAALQDYLAGFEERAKMWPAYISSAFPRFHDIYQSAGARDYWGYLSDSRGHTFRQTLSRALGNNSALAMVVTWNDFAEGTMVEPTVEYGFRDLGIIQDERRLHLESKFPYQTNDLTVPLRLYNLRRQCADDAALASGLDRVFTQIVAGELESARTELNQFEAGKPRKSEPEKKP